MLPYRPHPLLKNGHLQTLMVGLHSGRRPAYQAEAIVVELGDGESLVVHEEPRRPHAPAAPLVILIHGLGGDHSSPYIERIAEALWLAGINVWRLDLRGSGHGLDHAWRPPHAGLSGDLAAVLRAAADRFPKSDIVLAGFSLSGNIVIKFLGEAASGVFDDALTPALPWQRIRQAIVVAPPLDLHSCADNMDRWSRRVYSHYYLRNLSKQVLARQARYAQWQSLPVPERLRTIRQFDSLYTVPLSGFRDTDDYYSTASALAWVPNVQTPVLLMADEHDPIIPFQPVLQAVHNSPTIKLQRTRLGGHLGYFGLDDSGRLTRWMEHFVIRTLKNSCFAG